MKAGAQPLRAFLDAGVPDSIANVLRAHGHEVLLYREALPEAATDDEVCATAIANRAVLVVIDGDIRRIARRYGAKVSQDRFKTLDVIHLACSGPIAPTRLDQAMDLLAMEWAYCNRKAARRLWVEIGAHHIRTNR